MYNQRDIVLIPVPFTDLTSKKVRPAIVVSNNQYNHRSDDMLIVGVTSVLGNEPYSLDLTNEQMEEGTLPIPSKIRCDKLYLLKNKIAIRKYGKVNTKIQQLIQQQIKKLVE